MTSEGSTNSFKITLCLGIGSDGEKLMLDLNKASNNLLVVGKHSSIIDRFIDSLIGSVLGSGSPEDVRVIITNLRKSSLERYDGDPHVLAFVHKVVPSIEVMSFLTEEIAHRLELFSAVRARGISQYNSIVSEKPEMERLQHLVYIIDEIAPLMQYDRSRFISRFKRVTSLSRFMGIHLIFATSTVSSDVITGTLVSNFPTKIALRLENKIQSKLALGCKGAEDLNDGELLISQNWDSQIIKVKWDV